MTYDEFRALVEKMRALQKQGGSSPARLYLSSHAVRALRDYEDAVDVALAKSNATAPKEGEA